LTDASQFSSLTNSAIHNGRGIGVMVSSADHVTIDNNVMFFHHVGGIWMKASDDTTITNNVLGGFGTRYWSNDTRLDELAGFNLCNNDQNCANLILKNNIMGGSERIGFLLPTVACVETTASYENNMAHSVQHGAWVLRNTLLSGCQAFKNFKAYKTSEQGVFTYQAYSELEVSNIETLDCGRGVNLLIGGNFDKNKITLTGATIMGQTSLLPADSSAH
jgi:parallel beta-helix repeat protein